MEERYFYKEVNKQSRKEMVFYIKNHFTYNRLNSWNKWKGYANNVKIYNLGLTKEQRKKYYNIFLNTEIDTLQFYDTIQLYFEEFIESTGYRVYFNGSSNGYIVTDIDVLDYEDLKVMSKLELKKFTELLQDFNVLCDEIRLELINFLENAKIIEEVEVVKITKKTMVL